MILVFCVSNYKKKLIFYVVGELHLMDLTKTLI